MGLTIENQLLPTIATNCYQSKFSNIIKTDNFKPRNKNITSSLGNFVYKTQRNLFFIKNKFLSPQFKIFSFNSLIQQK